MKHRMPAWLWRWSCRLAGGSERAVESVVIPCAGANYIEEGTVAAQFAARSLPAVREIIIATDQPAGAFGNLPERVAVKTIPPRPTGPRDFEAIWQSRIIKLQAPLLANHEVILLMDSDMNLLRDFKVFIKPGAVLGNFRNGKMVAKLKNHDGPMTELEKSRRPYFKTHLNGAFLIACRATWQDLSREWLQLYESIWNKIPTGRPPTDQLPLCIALDRLALTTVDLGQWINWPVSKRIGDRPAKIPREVIGAHGGFPLSEWQKYLKNPEADLNFHGQEYTRKERYKA